MYSTKARRPLVASEMDLANLDDSVDEPIDAAEIFDHIRDINDPEHPYTLEQLNVVQVGRCNSNSNKNEMKCLMHFSRKSSYWSSQIPKIPLWMCALRPPFRIVRWPHSLGWQSTQNWKGNNENLIEYSKFKNTLLPFIYF